VVVIEYPAENGWKLTKDTSKPEESTATRHRFRVPVEAEKTERLTIETFRPEETQYALINLDSNLVTLLGQEERITPELEHVFDQVMAQKLKLSAIDQQILVRRQETDHTTSDQNRIRENMKSLKGSGDEKALLQRHTRELNAQEDRLASLLKETDGLQKQRDDTAAELDRIIMAVNLDEGF